MHDLCQSPQELDGAACPYPRPQAGTAGLSKGLRRVSMSAAQEPAPGIDFFLFSLSIFYSLKIMIMSRKMKIQEDYKKSLRLLVGIFFCVLED